MEYSKRLERLQKFISEGRLLRKRWSGFDQAGKETGCLLVALSPEVGNKRLSAFCPAEVMPLWFARLTPWIDDAGTEEHWPEVVRRYADLAARWSVLTAHDWDRLKYRVGAICIRTALESVGRPPQGTQVACNQVVELCERAGCGRAVENIEWKQAGRITELDGHSVSWVAFDVVGASAHSIVEAARSFQNLRADREVLGDLLIDRILDELERTIQKKEG